MKLSLFTPSHDTKYLLELYTSITDNFVPVGCEWEWVILVNGKLLDSAYRIPEAICNDPRVRIIAAPHGLSGIGALKREACRNCTGDWLLEVDHDDLLFPLALHRLVMEIQANPNAVFAYSDCVHFKEQLGGASETFGEVYGWDKYQREFRGHTYDVIKSFKPDASSLHTIGSAPDHLRAWKRDYYERINKHDWTLPVCDDQELMARTYLGGGEFLYIEEALYMYRVYADNSYKQQQSKLNELSLELADKYRHQLIIEWCRRESLEMLDLGGAHNPPKGFTTIDLVPPAHCIWNVVKDGIPRADDSIGCVRASDFLEHVPPCRDSSCDHSSNCVIFLMNEIYRVLVPGGWLISNTPSTDGRGAFQDPTHVSFWNSNSFWYYAHPDYAKYVPGIKCSFNPARVRNHFPSEFHKTHNIAYVSADMNALKGQRAYRTWWPSPPPKR